MAMAQSVQKSGGFPGPQNAIGLMTSNLRAKRSSFAASERSDREAAKVGGQPAATLPCNSHGEIKW